MSSSPWVGGHGIASLVFWSLLTLSASSSLPRSSRYIREVHIIFSLEIDNALLHPIGDDGHVDGIYFGDLCPWNSSNDTQVPIPSRWSRSLLFLLGFVEGKEREKERESTSSVKSEGRIWVLVIAIWCSVTRKGYSWDGG